MNRKPGQQTIQFFSPTTNFTGAPITPEQAFELVVKSVEKPADTNMEALSSSITFRYYSTILDLRHF